MKERYNLNPYILSDDEIEEYCRGCLNRDWGLRHMRQTLAEKSDYLAKELKIHEANYNKVDALLKENER
jgi:hypothetical protein